MPHQLLRATAAAVLLFSFACGQDISISANSLDQVATDDFLNATCLANANPGIDTLSAGDVFAVPLDCCGTESFVCGGAFCTLLAECANLQTGVGTISVTTLASTVTASVTGTMVTQSSDGTITSTAQTSETEIGATATTTSTSSDDGGAAGGGAGGGAGGAGGAGGGATATTGGGSTTNSETTTAPTDTTQASSTTQSTTSSSSSSSGTPSPTAWLISTKRNTARADFDAFIKTLPDQGQGDVIAYDNIPWQSYVTKNLTSDQADMVKMNSIVDIVGQITEEDGEAGIAATRKPRILKRENSPRAGSDYHLGILSAPRALMDTAMWPDYEFDTQLGIGQTIYIIDTGYRSTHQEFAATGRTVDDYVVPNAFTLSASPFVSDRDTLSPEDMTDYNGHGTAVASVAGGNSQGVASQANMVIIKFRNAAAQAGVGINQIRGVTSAALRDAWDYAINDVISRRNNGDTGKFVINMSYGFARGGPLPTLHELIMDRVIPFAAENDIVVTIPTGNDAPTSLAMVTPQNLGTTDNALITVAGVEHNGSLFTNSNPDLGTGGSITVYAAARLVLVASTDSDTSTTMLNGTSLAAPAVAGMAAYFFSLPELDANWPQGSIARAMKQFFVLSARIQRNNNPVPPNLSYAGPAPGSVVVAWNRHPGNSLAGCGAPAKVKRQDDLPDLSCPSPSSETSMTTMTLESTTTETSPTTSDFIPSETSTTTDPAMTASSFCTVVYGDGSSCVQVPNNTCGFGSQVICPLAKRGLHAATATTYYATGSFITAAPTAA
ncbi:hypothetical protein MBLNU13_g10227t1 [Cladosporium sp. NU13]